MDLHLRTGPEDEDRHRRARARAVRRTLWQRCRPVLGWTLAALAAALLYSGVRWTFDAASKATSSGPLFNGPVSRR